MACFSWPWFENFLIWLAVIIFIVAVAKLVIPWLLSMVGTPPGGGLITTLIQYIIWLVVAIAVIVFVFRMLECVGLPHLP